MVSLKDVSTTELVNELITRDGVRSAEVYSGEFCRVHMSGQNDERLRYLNASGPLTVLEVER